MFDLQPIVWLQSWASPPLTAVMNGISLLGYTRACLAIAVLLAFAFRVRAAVALLVLLTLTAALTDIGKVAAGAPRPDWDAGAVQALSLYAEDVRQSESSDPRQLDDEYGFPSGHVATTTAFAIGLAVLLGWTRRGWMAAAIWIALMGLSRMYLGRHFLGDVLGGVAVGLAAVLVGFAVLELRTLARGLRAHESWPAQRVLAIAAVLAGGALLVGLPDAADAGRLLGAAAGILVLVNRDVFEFALTPRARAILLAAAIAGFAAAWGGMSVMLDVADAGRASAWRLVASALPMAALLIVPAWVPRRWLQAGT